MGPLRFVDTDVLRVEFFEAGPTDAMLDRTALTFDNPECVDVVLHACRHRLGHSPGHAPYEEPERRLALQPAITVPGYASTTRCQSRATC